MYRRHLWAGRDVKKRLIAEVFAPAISAYLDREGEVGVRRDCPEEENFFEMYEVLGDRDKQEAIRQAHPEKLHCLDLEVSANACDGCPKNPVRKKAPDDVRKEREVLEENIPCLEHVIALSDYIRMGLVHDLRELSPDEALALRLTWQHTRARERAFSAEMMMTASLGGFMGGGRNR